MRDLKYQGYTIAFQEVPNEVSLTFNISGCERNCEGCHSACLQEYKGRFLKDDYETILEMYIGFVSCVCFMGGEQNMEELSIHIQSAKQKGLKTCVYSGSDNVDVFSSVLPHLDYLKIGSYNDKLGGLDRGSTNQVFYEVINGALIKRNDLFTHKAEDVSLNFDAEHVTRITNKLHCNNGYCPCSIQQSEDTKCMCKEFREQKTSGFCNCRLFYRQEAK